MKSLKLYLLLSFIFLLSCKHAGNNPEDEVVDEYGDEYSAIAEAVPYPDGTYCAEIDYYNPDTGTRSTYTLNVEVEDNELTVIQWPNGGWLDSTHFSPEELSSEGDCSFSSYDGNQYDIQITGSECSYTDNYRVRQDAEDATCPDCGDTKSTYDDRCDNCQNKIDKTCPLCGEYDSFMWKGDDMCSDCERKEEDRKREAE